MGLFSLFLFVCASSVVLVMFIAFTMSLLVMFSKLRYEIREWVLYGLLALFVIGVAIVFRGTLFYERENLFSQLGQSYRLAVCIATAALGWIWLMGYLADCDENSDYRLPA